jgi:hypothetical protein
MKRIVFKTYYPVCLTLIMVACLAAYTSLYRSYDADLMTFLADGLGFFFCTFAYFKLLDLHGFKTLFIQYDIVAKRIPFYGYIYPFLEFALGLAFLLCNSIIMLQILCWFTIGFIAFRAIGIVQAMRSKDVSLPCGCMGTIALFPINWTTIAANIATISAAIIILYYTNFA